MTTMSKQVPPLQFDEEGYAYTTEGRFRRYRPHDIARWRPEWRALVDPEGRILDWVDQALMSVVGKEAILEAVVLLLACKHRIHEPELEALWRLGGWVAVAEELGSSV